MAKLLKEELLKTYRINFNAKTTGKEYVTLESNNASNESEFAIYGNRLLNWMVDRFKAYDGNLIYKGTALEIGCGMGRLMKPASVHFKWISGVDISKQVLDEANIYLKDTPNHSLYENNGEDLSLFEDSSFDYIYSGGVIQHIPYRNIIANYLKEAIRVLKNKGLFLFTFQVWQTEIEGKGRVGAKLTATWLKEVFKDLPIELLEVVTDKKDPVPHISILVRKINSNSSFNIVENDILQIPWRTACWDDLDSMKQHQELEKKGQRKITFFDLE